MTSLLTLLLATLLNSAENLEPRNVRVEEVTYRGRKAIRAVETNQDAHPSIAIVKGTNLRNGEIEAEIVGLPAAGAPEGSRGFVGIAFRVASDASKFECFYLRPTNARADDQLRRNHSTQYVAHPDWPWHRLRKEHPGVYESYADMETGAWTHVRIVVDGSRAQLYVNRSPQPVLVVNDLKNGESDGAVALWIGQGTEAYFSNLAVKASRPASSAQSPGSSHRSRP